MKRIVIICIWMTICIASCVDLDQVNKFTTGALGVIKSQSDIEYTYTYSYLNYTLTKRGADDFLPQLVIDQGQLDLAGKADKAIQVVEISLESYFSALNKLSGTGTGVYDLTKVTDNIDSAALDKAGITKTQLHSAVDIVNKVLNEIIKQYKGKKIKEIITKNDRTVGNIIDAYCTALKKLTKAIDADEIIVTGNFNPVAASAKKAGNVIELDAINQQYQTEIAKLEKKKAAINKMIEGLQKLKTAHHDLAQKLATGDKQKIDSKEVITLLTQYGGEIYSIYSDIKQLNTK